MTNGREQAGYRFPLVLLEFEWLLFGEIHLLIRVAPITLII
jgi:hypothetical protein